MEVPNYESNSHKYRQEKQEEPREKLAPVVEGRKLKPSLGRRFIKTFFVDDIKDVKGYLIFDVLIPAIKDTLFNLINGGASMIFYGDVKPSRGKTTNRNYDPNRTIRIGAQDRVSSYSSSGRRRAAMNDFEDIVLDSRADCQRVLDAMNEAIYTYGQVTVADLYDLVGMTSEFTDYKFGWVDLKPSGYSRRRDGSYVLDLPKVVDLT